MTTNGLSGIDTANTSNQNKWCRQVATAQQQYSLDERESERKGHKRISKNKRTTTQRLAYWMHAGVVGIEFGIHKSARRRIMQILGVTSTHASHALAGVKGVESTSAAQAAVGQGVTEVQDSVTLSVDAVRAAESASDIRFDRVQSIRTAIAEGTYETAEKLDIALERLLERLG
jgi:anti-sigma28 factor (negative regulator of flagellin synthesis)